MKQKQQNPCNKPLQQRQETGRVSYVTIHTVTGNDIDLYLSDKVTITRVKRGLYKARIRGIADYDRIIDIIGGIK